MTKLDAECEPPTNQESKKTAKDVYELQCAVLSKELQKTELLIKLLEKVLGNVDRAADDTLALFSSLL